MSPVPILPKWMSGWFAAIICGWATLVCFFKFRVSGLWSPFIILDADEVKISNVEAVALLVLFGLFGYGLLISLLIMMGKGNKPLDRSNVAYIGCSALIAALGVTQLDSEGWLVRSFEDSCSERPYFADEVRERQVSHQSDGKVADQGAIFQAKDRVWSAEECTRAVQELKDWRYTGRARNDDATGE